jgi:hypothetical protein
MVMEKTRRPGLNWPRLGLRVAGAGLLAVTWAIHLDLYLTGYRSIPVIGWLFLLQVIAAFGLAAAVLVSGSRLAAAAGAGFALSTLGGYLLSVWIGLFGLKEIRTTAEHVIAMRRPSAGTRWLATRLESMTRPLAMMMRGGPPGRVPGRSTSSWQAISCPAFLTYRRPPARLRPGPRPAARTGS